MEISKLPMGEELRLMRGVEPIAPNKASQKPFSTAEQPSFLDFLKDQIATTNAQGVDVDRRMTQAVAGNDPNPHATMIALQQADISFKLMLSVKDRLIQAYEQLVRTPIG